ncbi:tRNA-processing RNAse BN [Sulfuricurvum kujiense DSM 16994]|uniref:tRNA-processing RNAse BN n=1 Tax=Sulfuricurvum kujiense (strain ATCC BAA-921 / DSM 16994 / JCM 11577 / YK-1) TaxID=709032 RepID=E4TWJ5_SULKY|nr:YhjD/YihY/BrkB family envelope integrity protein [Sulfuricurvum kujiense]ADR34841.1 tRNA-processing RNAse BN [Sulfuricurvum kujiense DSM 16994]
MKLKALLRHIRLFFLMLFDREITVYASSLSFYTIFTVVPLLIISLSLIANVPVFEEQYAKIQIFIFENMMPVQTAAVAGYLESFFQNSVQLGVIGFTTMIVSSLLFFQNFEHIVSKIFKVPKRGLWDAITTYWTLITLTPIVLIASMSLNAYLVSHVSGAALHALSIFPFLLLWGIFFVIYHIAVNADVSPKAAAISSFIVAVVWGIAKNSFIQYVFYNKTYATMYGSFSALIFFFLWIYVSWIIVIYGMKLCYLINRAAQRGESQSA